jgi:nucleoside-diphosphate-sugar epimerase
MKALITGGTGFVGRHLVRRLVAQDVDCRLLVRPESDLASLVDLNLDIVRGDVTEPASLRRVARGIDVVYHLAAEGHVTARSEEAYARFHRVNVEGTRNLAQACRQAPIRRFVHFSSTAAMGLIRRSPIDETVPCQPATPYQRSKWESEQVVLQAYQEYGLPAVVLRPCMVYGPGGRGEFQKFCKLFGRGWFPRLGHTPILLPLVHVQDVVRGALLAGERGDPGEVYLLASATSYSLDRIRQVVLEALGIRRPYFYVPVWAAMAGAYVLYTLARIRGQVPLVTPRNVASTLASRVFDIGKARRHLGYAPQVPLDTGIAETVAWYQEVGIL